MHRRGIQKLYKILMIGTTKLVNVWYHFIEDFENPGYAILWRNLPKEIVNVTPSYRKPEDLIRTLCGKIMLKRAIALSGVGGVTIGTLSTGVRRKPVLNNWWHFNISHSGQLVVLAFTPYGRVGIDVELRKKEDSVSELASVLHRNERKKIEESGSSYTAFYDLWTRKEAVLKAEGSGLTVDLNDLDVSVGSKIYFNGALWEVIPLSIHGEYSCHLSVDINNTEVFLSEQDLLMKW